MHETVVEEDQLALEQAAAAAMAAEGVRSKTPNDSPKIVVLLGRVETPFMAVIWMLTTGASKLTKVDHVPTAATTVTTTGTRANPAPSSI
jgi:hypothetical protein